MLNGTLTNSASLIKEMEEPEQQKEDVGKLKEQSKELEDKKEPKPGLVDYPLKSSMEILSELFNSFDAEPPLIIKKEKTDSPSKKVKKAKKKHKHKDKKTKRKDKKRKRSTSSSASEIDLAEILIKQEKESSEQRIKIEGTNVSINFENIKKEKEKTAKPRTDFENIAKREENGVLVDKSDIKPEIKHEERTNDAEEGELVLDDAHDGLKKRKHRHHRDRTEPEKSKKKKKDEKVIKDDDLRHKLKHAINKFYKERSPEKSTERHKKSHHDEKYSVENDFYRNRSDRDRERREHRSHERDKYKSSDYKSKRRGRDDGFYKEDDFWSRDRYRSYERDGERRYRDRSNSRDSSRIDKKKLLEIARKNAIQMMKSGSLPGALTLGPQAQEKVIAAIKAGGKSIEELTDFCKTLSKKEALGELSSNSDGGTDSDTDRPFHHPFQIKDRPTSITMNIKNSVPLPIKTTVERTSELRLQFPVSSGQLHRKTESEWVPVPPKKNEAKGAKSAAPILAIEAAPPENLDETKANDESEQSAAIPMPPSDGSLDLGSIVSQRLTAIRKLQENPNDVQALTEMYKVNKEMQSWAESKQQPGQFTGTTGAQVLTQAELTSGYQAWAKKDQLQLASPVTGGMGMHLLQKMGWKPGEGLGKEKSGALEPLLLEVKLDKKGLVANEEQRKKKKQGQTKYNNYTFENKHPVSLLGEYASKKKMGAPQYTVCFECGPDHKKNFLFKVILNGVEYKPNVASANKKEAKAAAATVCLQHLGLLGQPPAILPKS